MGVYVTTWVHMLEAKIYSRTDKFLDPRLQSLSTVEIVPDRQSNKALGYFLSCETIEYAGTENHVRSYIVNNAQLFSHLL